MQENKELVSGIILLAIGIPLILLPIIFLQALRLPQINQIPFLLRFLRSSPFLGLALCFLSWRLFGRCKNLSRKLLYTGELYIFVMSFIISLGLIEYSWTLDYIALQFLFFTIVIFTSNFVIVRKKTLLSVFLASSLFSIISAYFAYPFYQTSSSQLFYGITLFPNFQISSFFVLVFATTLLTLLFAYSLMSYLDSLLSEFLGRSVMSISATKSIAVHLQIVPMVLSPLAILQTFGKTEFLVPSTLFLYALCYSKFMTVIICPVITIIGRHIVSMKFLGITTLWSLISFVQNSFVIFNFVVLNMDAGAYAFVLIISSLFASALGISSSRSL
jgi:hypothetical protein